MLHPLLLKFSMDGMYSSSAFTPKFAAAIRFFFLNFIILKRFLISYKPGKFEPTTIGSIGLASDGFAHCDIFLAVKVEVLK